MKVSKFADARRRFLEPVATQANINFDEVVLAGYRQLEIPDDWGEPEIAFGLLGVGADMLMYRTRAEEFPATGRFAKKQAKEVERELGSRESLEAAALLARAHTVGIATRKLRAGQPAEAEVNEQAAALLERHYPLPAGSVERIDELKTESWEWADELLEREAAGEETGNQSAGVSAAQRFHLATLFEALNIALGPKWAAGSEDKLLSPDKHEFLAFSLAEGQTQLAVEDRRLVYVRAAIALRLITV